MPYTCLVEVKSTSKDTFKFGGRALTRLRQFAVACNLPLLFAVRFLRFGGNALWIIVADQGPPAASIKVTYEDWLTGLRPVLWDDYFIAVRPDTEVRITYGQKERIDGSAHPEYGARLLVEVTVDGQTTALSGVDAIGAELFLDCYDLEELVVDRHGRNTVVSYRPTLLTCSVADLTYKANLKFRDDDGQPVFDASRLLSQSDRERPPPVVTRNMIERMAAGLQTTGAVLGYMDAGDPDHHLAVWKRLGQVVSDGHHQPSA